jgi:hypothetical protein
VKERAPSRAGTKRAGGAIRDDWMLQAEAAALAGCSVSVIRKWRRAGAISDRARTSSGGLKRVEVRLGEVLAKMTDTMPDRVGAVPDEGPGQARTDHAEAAASATRQDAEELSASQVEVFVRHIAEAERRAAKLESKLRASEMMNDLLRERAESLQSQLKVMVNEPGVSRDMADRLQLLADKVSRYRRTVERSEMKAGQGSAQERANARLTFDVALVALCTVAGVETEIELGPLLTAADRRRLTAALEKCGLGVTS